MFTKIAYETISRKLSYQLNGYTYKTMNGSTKNSSYIFSWLDKFSNGLRTVSTLDKYGSTTQEITIFGNGNTPPTADDFQLAGAHFTTCSANVSVSFDSNSNTSTVLYTITNAGDEEFVVREVGVFYYEAMLMREVLDSPITIPAGGVGQVTLTLKVNIPE